MYKAPPKPSPIPSPQPVICVYCGSSDHRSMECSNCILKMTERKVVYPVQHPVDTPETNNVNLPQRLAKFRKSPILGPEIMTNLGLLATTCRDLQQADNTSNSHNAPHRANQIIKIVFLTEIIGTVIN